jgi:cytidine deaminase
VIGVEALATAAMERAYAPYSRFRVGAALVGVDGVVYTGCNVENSSYPAGMCAERVALGAAVTSGCRNFTELVIVTEADVVTSPCGMCRQALSEFGNDLRITSVTTGGVRATWSLAELLPSPFAPASLEHA